MRYSADIVVIDLEATCPAEDEGANAIERSEIIEVGAVRLHRRSLEVIDSFSELVRPSRYAIPPFIARMTGIDEAAVAGKDGFAAVGDRFLRWYGPRNRSIVAAFGAYYDIPLLRLECERHGLDFRSTIAGGALDLRAVAMVWLAERQLGTSGVTLTGTLEKMGVRAELQQHRAVDDARMAAAVLQVFHIGHALI